MRTKNPGVKCVSCVDIALPLTPLTSGPYEGYACFSCMMMFYNLKEVLQPVKMIIKRVGPGDWKVGLNPQTTKNTLFDEELEHLYTLWIGRRVIE